MTYYCKGINGKCQSGSNSWQEFENGLCDNCYDELQELFNHFRQEIQAERISYGEIAELQSLAPYIDPSDTLLLEWAGVPEFKS